MSRSTPKGTGSKSLYKSKQKESNSTANRRKSRGIERKQLRDDEVNKRRLLSDDMSPVVEDERYDEDLEDSTPSKVQMKAAPKAARMTLQEKLKLWREEKKKKQEAEKKKNQPLFRVGGMKHSIEGDLYKQELLQEQVPEKKATTAKPAVVTRARKENAKPAAKARVNTAPATSLRKASTHTEPKKVIASRGTKPDADTITAKRTTRSASTAKKASTKESEKPVSRRGQKEEVPALSAPRSLSRARQTVSTSDLSCKLTAAAKAKMAEQKHSDFLKAKPRARTTRSSTLKAAATEGKPKQATSKVSKKIHDSPAPAVEQDIIQEEKEEESSSDSQSEFTRARPRHSTPLTQPTRPASANRKSSNKKRRSAMRKLEENLSIIVDLDGKRSVDSSDGEGGLGLRDKAEDCNVTIRGASDETEDMEYHDGGQMFPIVDFGDNMNTESVETATSLEVMSVPNLAVTLHLSEARRNVSLWATSESSAVFGKMSPKVDTPKRRSVKRGSLSSRLSMPENILDRSDKENVIAAGAEQEQSPAKKAKTPRRKSTRISTCAAENSEEEVSSTSVTKRKSVGRKSLLIEDTDTVDQMVEPVKPVKTPRRKSVRIATIMDELSETSDSTVNDAEKTPKTPRRKSTRKSSTAAGTLAQENIEEAGSFKNVKKTPGRKSLRLSVLAATVTDSSDTDVVSSPNKAKKRQSKSMSNQETLQDDIEDVYVTSDSVDNDTQAALPEDSDATPISQQRERMGSVIGKRQSIKLATTSASSADESNASSGVRQTPRSTKKRLSKRLSSLGESSATLQSPKVQGTPISKRGKGTPASKRRSSRRSSRKVSMSEKRKSLRKSTRVSVSDEGTDEVVGDNLIESVKVKQPATPAHHETYPSTPRSSRRSARRSTVVSVSDEGTTVCGELCPPAYHVKPGVSEKVSRILQELVVEKVDGETSFIEVPFDSSVEGESPYLRSGTTPGSSSSTTQNSTEQTDQSTQPFTPRTSEELTQSSSSVETLPHHGKSSSRKHVQIVTPDPGSNQMCTPKATKGSSRLRGRSLTPYTSFKEPGTPLSALRKGSAKRRKTEHTSTPSRTPEEMIEILKRSPMVEMDRRRRSRHASSPGTPSRFDFGEDIVIETKNLSAPELTPGTSFTRPNSQTQDNVLIEQPTAEPDNVPCTESNQEFAENLNVEQEEEDSKASRVKYFRNLLVSETERLTRLCSEWEEVNNFTFGLTEEVQGQIRSVIGKAQLLMDQRFKQFSGLVDDCEFNRGEKETTPTDLQGFWEMIFFQVEDVNALFVKLHELRMNNWQVKQPSPKKKMVKKPASAATKQKKAAVKSNFAAFRAAMMKQKGKATIENAAGDGQGNEETKTFDAGFFKVNSPVKSPAVSKSKTSPLRNAPEANASSSVVETESDAPKTTVALVSETSVGEEEPVNKENQEVSSGELQTPSFMPSLSAKRLRYQPKVDSPLLIDSTDFS